MTFRIFVLLLVLPITVFKSIAADKLSEIALMPWPQQVELAEGELIVNGQFKVVIGGHRSERLTQSANRFSDKANKQSFAKTASSKVTYVNVAVKSEKTSENILDTDESYQLEILMSGINISANTDAGAMQGLQSLLQLIGVNEGKGLRLPLLTIKDHPRFKWRGLMLDPARHFLPIDAIKRQIDGMESAKLNVFHWHLTDDQGWRIESNKYPKLHQLASDGDYYTKQQMRDVVKYANDRGIRVLPEVDVPGHASAIAVAYPELISLPGNYEMQRHWGVHAPTLNPIDEKVYQFVDDIVEELAEIFPDPYFHIGGDEVKPDQWQKNSSIHAFIKSNELVDYKGMQAHFNKRVNDILQKHNKKMVGWDEIFHSDLPKDIVIQSWRGHDSINYKVKNGRQSLLSTGYYVDQAQPTSYHYRNDPVPKQDVVHGLAKPGETWQTWSFKMPRLRGSAVKGSFTLFTHKNGNVRGFIDFDGRSRRKLNDIQVIDDETRFWVDNWMGKMTPRVNLTSNKFESEATVANGRYNISGSLIAASNMKGTSIPEGIILPTLTNDEEQLVLGGEATLWGENIIPEVLDLRLWPRTYAIAERLWSAKEVTDVESMYRRMSSVSYWAEKVVGLNHEFQAEDGMKRLLGNENIKPWQVLAEAIEQAQYYHRHHAKGQIGEYHQQAPLDRFVDTLPVESLTVRELILLVNKWLKDTSNDELFKEINSKFSNWQRIAEALIPKLSSNQKLNDIKPIVVSVLEVSKAAQRLTKLIKAGNSLSQEEYDNVKKTLHNAMQIRQEIVVTSAYVVESLLFRAANKTDKTFNYVMP